MYSKQDFDTAVENIIEDYPQVAALYKAGDPRILAPLSAIAQMAAMLSQQIEIEGIEVFSKVRDATVLADASMRGIVPKGIPMRVKVAVENPTNAPYTLAAGRTLTDAGGNPYVVDTPVTVAAGQTGYAELLQQTTRVISHTVTESRPFYQIPVDPADDGSHIAGIAVADSTGVSYRYAQAFTNVGNGDKVFHVETDEYQQIYVRFGYGGVVGVQPAAGDVYTLTITDTVGEVEIASGSPFSLDYTLSPQDSQIRISLDSVLRAGKDPMDVDTLRELCKYPSIYDHNAVYLGEFDYLIRRNVPDLRFLSVWNEQIEEQVREASVDNINKLFISFEPPEGADRETYEELIRDLIAQADDSYRIEFVEPNVEEIEVTISASVARIHDTAAVTAQIRDALLLAYGQDSAAVRAGMFEVQYKAIYQLLRSQIPALQDAGSDFSVVVTPLEGQKPEDYRYMTADSLTITVTPANYNNGSWGR